MCANIKMNSLKNFRCKFWGDNEVLACTLMKLRTENSIINNNDIWNLVDEAGIQGKMVTCKWVFIKEKTEDNSTKSLPQPISKFLQNFSKFNRISGTISYSILKTSLKFPQNFIQNLDFVIIIIIIIDIFANKGECSEIEHGKLVISTLNPLHEPWTWNWKISACLLLFLSQPRISLCMYVPIFVHELDQYRS